MVLQILALLPLINVLLRVVQRIDLRLEFLGVLARLRRLFVEAWFRLRIKRLSICHFLSFLNDSNIRNHKFNYK